MKNNIPTLKPNIVYKNNFCGQSRFVEISANLLTNILKDFEARGGGVINHKKESRKSNKNSLREYYETFCGGVKRVEQE